MADNLRQQILQDNPIAYWNLGETTGTVADNSGTLGNAVDGTYYGAPTQGVGGLVAGGDGAADFDGVDDGIAIANHDEINLQSHTQRTVELWFNADTLDGQQVLYEEGGHYNGLNIFLDGDRLNLGAWVNSAGKWLDYGISANKTYHVVLVFDNGTLSGYVNNQKMGEVDTGFTTLPPHDAAIGIGQMRQDTRFSNASGEVGNNGRYFDGTIDEVLLYNNALSGDRISAHYEASLAPIAQWSLGETTGTVADNSGTLEDAVDGTYSGAPTLGVDGLVAGGDGAVEFDGVNDGIAIPNHSQINLQGHTQRTVELWFNADTLDGQQVLYEEGGTINGLNISLDGDRLNLGAWANSAGKWLDYGISANTTYHVVLVFDNGTLSGYVNNQKMGEVDTGFTTLPPHGAAIGIGQMRNDSRFSNASGELGDGHHFDGTIDNVSLYNGALTADAVSDRYIASLAPIAQWSLGETTGTVADNSGTLGDAVDGNYAGALTLGVEGLIEGSDGAAEFDGVNARIAIPNHDQINTQDHTQRTVELWFNADTLEGKQVLYEEGGTTNGLNIFLDGDRLNLGAWANSAGEWLDYGIEADTTYHVVLVFDNGTLSGYVNNQKMGEVDTEFTTLPVHAGDIGIGHRNDNTRFSNTNASEGGNNKFFDGTIDEVLLYNGALTADAVSDRYTANVKISDRIAGDAGDNTLSGGIGDDTIDAGGGNDLIAGNEGNDVLTGGEGSDAFIFDEITGFVDRILDFNPGQDRLVVSPSIEATSIGQFSFDSNTQNLSFNGNAFAKLEGVSSLDLTRDLLIQQRLEIDENAPFQAVVGSVAIDNPAADNAYEIVDASKDGVFYINNQGQIRVGDGLWIRPGASGLNYEGVSEYSLQVRVTDDLGQTYTKEVLIGINDLNEAPEILNGERGGGLQLDINRDVSENATAGTVVTDLSVADDDIHDRVLFEIETGNDTGIFQIDPVEGTITVADPTQLDYETQTGYNLTVKATDSSGASDVANVRVNVTDENEAPIVEDRIFYWKELGVQQAAGAIVGKIEGFDPNNDNLTYRIAKVNSTSVPSGMWKINESTGEIYIYDVAASEALPDFKRAGSQAIYKLHHADAPIELTVEVSDGELTDTATVTLKQDKFIGFFEKKGGANPFNGSGKHNANVSSVGQTKPTFVDLDKDGDLDAVFGVHFNSGSGALRVYENDGEGKFSSANGLLPLRSTWGHSISLSNVGSSYPSPAFGDVDGDGDLDMVLGNDNKIRYFKNNNGTFREQTDANNPFSGIDLEGKQTTAVLGDVNGDGRIDLLLGRNNTKNKSADPGTLYLYDQKVNGSFNSSATSTKELGTGSDDRRPSPTLVDIDYDGKLDIVTGVENGEIRYFKGDGSTNLGNFVHQTGSNNPFELIDIGDESTPAFGDINNDGYLDLAVGTGDGNGRVLFFANPPSDGTLEFKLESQNLWNIPSISKNFDLGGFSEDFTKSTKVGPVKVFGGAAFDFGFEAGFELEPGTISADLPFNLLVDVPEQASVGETIDLGAAVQLNPDATFNTTTPYVKAGLDLDFEFYLGGGIEVDYGVGKAEIDLADFLGTDINFSTNQTFDSRTLELGKTFGVSDNPELVKEDEKEKELGEAKASDLEPKDYEDFNFADFKFKSPNLDVEGAASSGYSISGTKTSTLVETNLLIDDTLVYLFKKSNNPYLYKLATYWQDEKKLGSSKVSWNLLDLGLGGEINLKAKYELTFDDITGTLYVENGSGGYTSHGTGNFDELTGQFADVRVGSDGNGNGKLDYYIDFALVNPELNTKMDLLVGDLTLDLGLLKGSADINAGFFKDKFKFSAFEDTFKLGSVNKGFNILNQTIDLDEFAAATYRGAIDLV